MRGLTLARSPPLYRLGVVSYSYNFWQLYAAVTYNKPIVFQCRAVEAITRAEAGVDDDGKKFAATIALTDIGATFNMLLNFSLMFLLNLI